MRLVNAIAFYGRLGSPPPQLIADDLYTGYRDLWSKREFHLGGNHLLENALALAAGAAAFGDIDGQRRALRLLTAEIREQYLPDGLHYERSFTYHALLTYRQLLVLAILDQGHHDPSASASADLLRASLPAQLAVIRRHTPTIGPYPRFNDVDPAAPPPPQWLYAFAKMLGVTAEAPLEVASADITYRTFTRPNYQITVDVGAFAPDHLPAHAHCDALSFGIHDANGSELIVDTGTSTYEASPTRLRERSTAAHNTVEVGLTNQAEIWAAFRVGRKPRVTLLDHTPDRLVARVEAARGTSVAYTHTRALKFDSNAIKMTDRIATVAAKSQRSRSRLHVAPGVNVEQRDGYVRLGRTARVSFSGAEEVSVEPYRFAVGFNRTVLAYVVVAAFRNELSTAIELH